MPTRTWFPNGVFEPFFEGVGPDFPDRYIMSIDDEQVKEVMLKLGCTDLFVDATKENRPGRGDTRAIIDCTHPTHWLMFERHENWPNPRDNGYVMQGWPKSKFNKAEITRALQDYLDDVTEGKIIFKESPKTKNQ